MGNRCAKFFVAVFIPILAAVCSGCSLHSEQSYDKNGVAMDTAVYLKATGEESKDPGTRQTGKFPAIGQRY